MEKLNETRALPQFIGEGCGAPFEKLVAPRSERTDQINALLNELQTAKGEKREEILAALKNL